MAKSSTNSKAQTKTPKKTASTKASTKNTAKQSSAIPEAKAAAQEQKVTTAKPVRKSIARQRSLRGGFGVLKNISMRNMHLASAVLFVLAAIATGFFVKESSYQLTLAHLTPDALLSQKTTVFVSAQHALMDIDLRWILVAMLALSAVFSALRATRLRAAETRGLMAHILPMRWLDYAVTGLLTVEIVALLLGQQDLVTIKFFGLATALAAVFAWIAERENANAPRLVRGAYAASLLTGALTILGLAAYALATPLWGQVRAPWFVYAACAVVALGFVGIAWNQLRAYRKANSVDYARVERHYIIMNAVLKLAFAAVLIAGLHR